MKSLRLILIALILAIILPIKPAGGDDILIFVGSGGGGGSSCTMAVCSSASADDCPCDQTENFISVWDFENNLLAEDATTCGTAGTDCDLTGSGEAYDATNKLSGSYALDFDHENDYARCGGVGEGACDTTALLNPATTQDFTMFCFVRPDSDSGATNKEIWDVSDSSNSGYLTYRNKGNDDWRSRFRSGGSWDTADPGNSTATVNVWSFVAQVMDNTTSTNYVQTLYIAEDGSDIVTDTNAATGYTRDSNPDFYIGSATSDSQEGQYDLCGLAKVALTDDQLCIMCSCGPGNEFDCECSDGDPTTWKSNTGRSGDCLVSSAACINSVSIACDASELESR